MFRVGQVIPKLFHATLFGSIEKCQLIYGEDVTVLNTDRMQANGTQETRSPSPSNHGSTCTLTAHHIRCSCLHTTLWHVTYRSGRDYLFIYVFIFYLYVVY